MAVGETSFLAMNEAWARQRVKEWMPGIADELSSGHSDRCTICNRASASIGPNDTSLRGEVYEQQCSDCGTTARILRVVLFIESYATVRRTAFRILTEASDCNKIIRPTLDCETRCGETTYPTEAIREYSEGIEQHHLSYEPEITVPLCKSCHEDVHHSGKYPAFEPS